jgi:hypothetical protein
VPRTWEWNLHALQRMNPVGDKSVHVADGDAQMCVEMLASPDAAFTQTDQFTVAPQKSSMNERTPNQWHGKFASAAPSESADFVALLRIGADCSAKRVKTEAARIPGGWELKIGDKTVKLDGDVVTVR